MLLTLPFQAQAKCVTITTVPIDITKPAYYCLQRDVNGTQVIFTAIQIKANYVTIDFQGYSLIGKHHPDNVPPPSVAILADDKKYTGLSGWLK